MHRPRGHRNTHTNTLEFKIHVCLVAHSLWCWEVVHTTDTACHVCLQHVSIGTVKTHQTAHSGAHSEWVPFQYNREKSLPCPPAPKRVQSTLLATEGLKGVGVPLSGGVWWGSAGRVSKGHRLLEGNNTAGAGGHANVGQKGWEQDDQFTVLILVLQTLPQDRQTDKDG